MQLVSNNKYRIVGVLSTATAKEIHRQSSKLKKYVSVKKEIKSELDFSFFERLDRTESLLQNAFSDIEQSKDKVVNSLFWFAKVNTFDDIAIAHLIAGNPLKALDTWEKVTKNKPIKDSNISSFSNISTLLMCYGVEEGVSIPLAIKTKCDLIESPYFCHFVESVADKTFITTRAARDELKFLVVDKIFQELSRSYSNKNLLNLFNECDQNVKDYISKKIVSPLLSDVEKKLKDAIKGREKAPHKAFTLGCSLYLKSRKKISLLKSILGESDFTYKQLVDDISLELIQCDIINFNTFNEEKDTSNECYTLMGYAQKLAVSQSVKNKIDESIAYQKEYAAQALLKAHIAPIVEKIETFSATENAALRSYNISSVGPYLSNCRTLLKIFAAEIGSLHEEYISVSSAVVTVALQRIILICNRAQDNKLDVDRLSTIFNSAVIQINNLSSFSMSYDVKQRLNENKPIIISVSEAINAAKNKSEGCYIATMAYGDYSHPQVLKLREFRDETLSKSKLGRWFIKFYYRNSPGLVKKLKGKSAINNVIRTILNLFIKAIQK